LGIKYYRGGGVPERGERERGKTDKSESLEGPGQKRSQVINVRKKAGDGSSQDLKPGLGVNILVRFWGYTNGCTNLKVKPLPK